MAPQRDPTNEAVLTRLLEDNHLSDDSLLYREAERSALLATTTPGVYRLKANPRPGESVLDAYGQGYVVQAEQLGPGLAFVQSAAPNWQETMELRALRAGKTTAAASGDRVEVEVRLGDVLGQGGLMYPVESVTVERAWYFTLPQGSIEVREVPGP